jgi:hypothetical protein
LATRPRVMVSSVVRGFEEDREAARDAIVGAGGEPVLVNEDQPSQSDSSRNVCLDAVASSDVYICIIGERGGFVAPSGKLVVEEEFEEARARKVPVLLFVKAGAHDDEATRLLGRLQDYVSGLFRKEYSDVAELGAQIRESMDTLFPRLRMQYTNPESLATELAASVPEQHTPFLRTVFAPERLETVIDPRWLGRGDLVDQVLEVGHRRAVGLLSYSDGTEIDQRNGWATICKVGVGQRGHASATIRISEEGWLSVTAAVKSELEGDAHGFSSSMVLAREAIEDTFRKCFGFAREYYELIDPHRKHSLLFWNAALLNLGMRRIESSPRPRNSWSGIGSSEAPVLAYPRTQRLTRDDLFKPEDEMDKALYKIESAASQKGQW